LIENEEKSMASEMPDQEETTQNPDAPVDEEYSLPLSAGRDTQWIPPQVLYGYPGAAKRKEAPLPEPGFTAAAWKEAGLCAVLFLAFALIIFYLPGLGVLASLLMPLILAKLLLRRGLILSALATVVPLLAVSLLIGFPAAGGIFLQYAGMGFVFGISYRKKKKALSTFLLAALCCLLGHALSICLGFLQDGLSFSEFWPTLKASYEEILRALAETSGMFTGVSLNAFVDFGVTLMQRIYFGMNILSAMLTAGFCYWLSSSVLRRQGHDIPPMAPFLSWSLDWRFSWPFILGLLFSLLSKFLTLEWMQILGATLAMVFGFVLAVCGLSFLLWLMKGLRFPGLLKGLAVFLLLLFAEISVYVLAFLAVFADMKELRSRFTEKWKIRESEK